MTFISHRLWLGGVALNGEEQSLLFISHQGKALCGDIIIIIILMMMMMMMMMMTCTLLFSRKLVA